jgi:hypothetical protein
VHRASALIACPSSIEWATSFQNDVRTVTLSPCSFFSLSSTWSGLLPVLLPGTGQSSILARFGAALCLTIRLFAPAT